MLNVGDTAGARQYIEHATRQMEQLGMKKWKLKFNLTLAQIYRVSDIKRSEEMLMSLLEDEYVKSDTLYYNIVLHNAYLFSQNIVYIQRALPLIRGRAGFRSVEGLYESYMMNDLLQTKNMGSEADRDSLLGLVRAASANVHPGASVSTRFIITRECARAYRDLGMTDSALNMYALHTLLVDSLRQISYLDDIQKAEFGQKINLIETRARENMLEERIRMVIAVSLILIASVVIVLFLYRRNQRAEMHRIRADLELTRSRLQLASSAVMLQEKDSVIDSVLETIVTMSREGKVSQDDARIVSSAIKVHKSSKTDLETFHEIHEKLDPSFQHKLKTDFPALSESNLRMASYIAIGMGSKQIARVMGIEYKSVITARHRLRAKMGLSKEDSLEDTLRKYSGIR